MNCAKHMQTLIIIGRRLLRRHRILQIALLVAFWLLGQAFVRWAHLPLPGAIAGMLAVLALLASGWLEPACIRAGAHWFLSDMLLFFVPAVVAVLDHRELLGWLGLKALLVILVGTVIVMGTTALVVELTSRPASVRPEASADVH
jgi:holin-like protein